MASGTNIKVEGLEALIQKFKSIPKAVKQELDAELHSVANEYENKAVSMAPRDQSLLIQGIKAHHEVLKHEIVSSAPYSAYLEFGTKSRAKIPPDLATYASQFRGKGNGGGKGFYDSILEWVKRKGITGTYNVKTRRREGSKIDKQIEDEQVAFAIYLSIMRHGIHAQPFFFPHLPWAQAEVQKRSKQAIEKALNK